MCCSSSQLKAPDAAHFALVSNPLHDQILERRSLEGGTNTSGSGSGSSAHVGHTASSNNAVTHVLHSDAVSAKRAAANASLPLRERLAAAVAGARLDAVADLRQSQVVQDQALSTLARATATRALTETATDSGVSSCSDDTEKKCMFSRASPNKSNHPVSSIQSECPKR